MKMVGLPEDTHEQLKKISKATGILMYRLLQEALEIIEEKYKEKIQKYDRENNE